MEKNKHAEEEDPSFRLRCSQECIQLAAMRTRVTTASWLLGILLAGLLAANGWVQITFANVGSQLRTVQAQYEATSDRVNGIRADMNLHYTEFIAHERADIDRFNAARNGRRASE